MKYRIIVPVFAAAFVLQPFLNSLLPWGSAPQIILASGIMLCYFYVPEDTLPVLITGSVFQLLSDISGDQFIGASVIAFVLVIGLTMIVRKLINVENFLMVAGVYLGTNVLYYVILWVLYRFTGSPYGFLYAMARIPAPVTGSFLFGMILYFIIIRKHIKHRRDRYFR